MKNSSRDSNTFQLAAVGSSSAQSVGPLGTQVYQVRLATDQPVRYLISEAPAVTSSTGALLPPYVVDYKTVTPGQRVSVIAVGSTANVTVTEQV